MGELAIGVGRQGIPALPLTAGNAACFFTFSAASNRVAGTFTGSGEYMNLKTTKPVLIARSSNTFGLQYGADH